MSSDGNVFSSGFFYWIITNNSHIYEIGSGDTFFATVNSEGVWFTSDLESGFDVATRFSASVSGDGSRIAVSGRSATSIYTIGVDFYTRNGITITRDTNRLVTIAFNIITLKSTVSQQHHLQET